MKGIMISIVFMVVSMFDFNLKSFRFFIVNKMMSFCLNRLLLNFVRNVI